LERSGSLVNGGGWYYQSIREVTSDDSVTLQLLDVLAREVGVIGVFSDWPATTTFYANCML
jgi:glycerophosphoryl diester phosphodiesterase